MSALLKRTFFFICILGLSAFFLILADKGYSQNNKADKGVTVPEGMELIQISNGYNILVPKGVKVTKDGGQIKVEDEREFFLRRFKEIEDRINALEQGQAVVDQLLEAQKTFNLTLDELNGVAAGIAEKSHGFSTDIQTIRAQAKESAGQLAEVTAGLQLLKVEVDNERQRREAMEEAKKLETKAAESTASKTKKK